MSKATLDGAALLGYWVERLRLDDWVIDLRDNCSPDEFLNQGNVGECEWQEVNKSAVIRILNPIFYGQRVLPFNYEKTLVHELLHIKFALLDESDNYLQNRIVHQLIDELAKALVEARNHNP